jgi:hypothetical protein
MRARFFPLAFALLFLAQFACAQFYVLENHSIGITVDDSGNALVAERYYISFQNDSQLVDFRKTVADIGVDVGGWRAYDKRIYPRIGQPQDIVVNGISFIENENALDFLEMTYSLKAPIMNKASETSRVVEYELKTDAFSNFINGSLWVIPKDTTITVQLPRGVEIHSPVKPDAIVGDNTVIWKGYVFGNELELNYSFFKDIASFDLGQALNGLVKSDLFLIILAVAAVAFAVILVKRKAIAGSVESYIIAHSDLGGEEEE